jgi:hypothetical protein
MYKDESAVLQYAQGKAPYSVPPHHRFDASCRSRTRVDLYIRTYCKSRNIQIRIPLSDSICNSDQTPTPDHMLPITCYQSLPVSRPKINRLTSPHIVHNLLDAPGLVLVARRVVGLERSLVLHVDALLHALGALVVVLICVCLRVVRPHPLGQLGLRAARVELDFVPVGVLEKLGVGEAEFLGAGVADETVVGQYVVRVGMKVRAYRKRMWTRTDWGMLSLPPICRHDAIEMASSMACVAPLPEAGR